MLMSESVREGVFNRISVIAVGHRLGSGMAR